MFFTLVCTLNQRGTSTSTKACMTLLRLDLSRKAERLSIEPCLASSLACDLVVLLNITISHGYARRDRYNVQRCSLIRFLAQLCSSPSIILAKGRHRRLPRNLDLTSSQLLESDTHHHQHEHSSLQESEHRCSLLDPTPTHSKAPAL